MCAIAAEKQRNCLAEEEVVISDEMSEAMMENREVGGTNDGCLSLKKNGNDRDDWK